MQTKVEELILVKLEALDKRFDGLDDKFDSLESRFDNLEGRFDSLESRFDNLESQVTGLTHAFYQFKISTEHNLKDLVELNRYTGEFFQGHENRIAVLEKAG